MADNKAKHPEETEPTPEEWLELLHKGVEDFNKFRQEYPEWFPLLPEEVDLQEAELPGVHLQMAGLKGAHLEKANLKAARLGGAELTGAHLREADLRQARFQVLLITYADWIIEGEDSVRVVTSPLGGPADWIVGGKDRVRVRGPLFGGPVQVSELEGFGDLDRVVLPGPPSEKDHLVRLVLSHGSTLGYTPAIGKGPPVDGASRGKRTVRRWFPSLKAARLDEADLEKVNLEGADLSFAYLSGANLQDARLACADLNEAHLDGADLRRVRGLEEAKLDRVFVNSKTRFRGVDTSRVRGEHPVLARLIDEAQFVEDFATQHPVVAFFWRLTADYGRSLKRWAFCSLLIALAFGLIFTFAIPDSFQVLGRPATSFTYFYFSIVTFTTLGFGDVVPKDLWGEILLSVEVVLGYVMLGGLISILATKLARRS